MKFVTLSKFSVFILFIVWNSVGEAVKINRLQVPEIIRYGAQAILDCDFTIEEYETELVVKWFLNKNLVYQWIPGTKSPPTVAGVLKDRLNLEYVASIDANSIHRALHILKVDPELSGEYTCSISTFQSEDIRNKSMTVLVSEKMFELKRVKAAEGLIRVQCQADGIFPKPVMTLHSQEREIIEADVSSRKKGQLYEITASATLPALESPEVFSCKLYIPQANYTTIKETVFYPGSHGTSVTPNSLSLTMSTVFVLVCYLGLRRTFLDGC